MNDHKEWQAINKRHEKIAGTGWPWRHVHMKLRPDFPTIINEIINDEGDVIIAWAGLDQTDWHQSEKRDIACFLTHAPDDIAYLLNRVKQLEQELNGRTQRETSGVKAS